MKIESLSIRSSTIAIISMIGLIAIVLSMFAGTYFKQAALDAQINSLSRVIQVASQEMLKQVRSRTFDLGMKLGHSEELISVLKVPAASVDKERLVKLLDDPFVNGFVGFSEIDLEKIRVYNLQLELIGESNTGPVQLADELTAYLSQIIKNRKASDRLKAVDALWMSEQGPLFSTLVPLGGLRPVGYLEIIVNPVFNLPDIGNITKTPVRIYTLSGDLINTNEQVVTDGHLPVEYILHASDGTPAFKIAGYENIDELSREMDKTQTVTITGFLLLSFGTLLFALWLFHRFLFTPLSRMIADMEQITHGKLELTVNNKGLREFHILADAFNSMTDQVRMRTNDLQRLLDLDENALMCFDHDNDAVYFNAGATSLFGYASDEIVDLDSADLFVDDIKQLIESADAANASPQSSLHIRLGCKHQDGHVFHCDASINTVDVLGQSGIAIALNAALDNELITSTRSYQRLDAVEETLSGLLAFAKENPAAMPGLVNLGMVHGGDNQIDEQKSKLREQVVKVMNMSLSCWEHELNKTKLDLAEESGLWPVYIDKSTPTTRTLDKYLNIDSCPKNPRSQRAVDTAEFVLRKMSEKLPDEKCAELKQALEAFRQLLSGIKSGNK
ncbi:MAG: PAS domain S-box protein [Gammaproteobacteria bacterium]|nr:PAS domain S-box protein [Gammaproteobacteria bacterium]NNJ48775.1 PAS domain S-box protein [Gammaproteobacteria bacterium]